MTDSATGSLNSVVFWDTKTFLRRKSAQPFPKSCQLASLSWSSTNPKLAVVPQWGDRIAICDFHDDIMTWTFLLHKEGGVFTCGSLMHNSRYLASGCGNSTVLIWDLKNKSIIKTFQGHSSAVSSVVRSSNDHLVVSGSQNGTILMHTVSNSAPQKVVNLTKDQPLKQTVNRLSFSYMEKSHLGSVCDDGVVCLWSIESQRMLAQLSPSHTSPATDICFSPSNKMLMVSVGLDSKIKCYDIQTRKTVTEITAPAPLSSVALLKDGTTLVGGGADGKLYVYELRLVKTPRDVIEAHQSPVTCIAQQHTKSSSRRASSRGSVSTVSRSKDTPPSPNKTTSVLVSSPEKPTINDGPSVTSSSATVAPVVPSSTAAAGLESHDSRLLREEDGPLVGRASHIQPIAPPLETVTPFVTTQHQGAEVGRGVKGGKKKAELPAGLSVQTPLGVTSKHQNKPGEGLPYVMDTPANLQGHTSSIFSPLDAQLVTPVHKVTAAIAPTVRSTPLDTAHSVTPFSSNVQPGNVSQSQFASGGIFSPLDNGLRSQSSFTHQSVMATPGGVMAPVQGKLDTSLNLSAMGPPSSFTSAGVSRFSGQSVQERLTSQPTPTHPLELQHSAGVHLSNKDHKEVDTVSTEQFSATPPSQQTVRDREVTHQQPSLPSSQLPPSDIPKEETSSSSSTSLPISLSPKHAVVPDTQLPQLANSHIQAVPQLEGSAAAAVAPAPGIQMKFMENMIKDSQEELWYSVHKDIRALSVDMFRQFFAMQQQSAAQFAALNEKVERLSEENKRLQEMVYQYMPKH